MVIKHLKLQTKTLEDYLKAIYRLEEIYSIAKTQDIAFELGVTPATVSKTLKKLAENNYVYWTPYEGVRLTKKGRIIAENVVKKHRIAETFLYFHLGFDLINSHKHAHTFEHLPTEILDRLWIYMQKPRKCPHGNPIPGADDIKLDDQPLSEFREGTEVVVTRILCSFDDILISKILSLNIRVGTKIRIESVTPSIMILNINGKKIELSKRELSLIRAQIFEKYEIQQNIS